MAAHINIISGIDEDSFLQFKEEFDAVESNNVIISLCSEGGDALVALAFYDYIKQSDKHVTIIAYGQVMSAAVLLLAAGNERLMAPNAWVMVHQDTGEITGEVHEIKREAAQMQRLEDQWNALLALNTVTSSTDWAELHRKTTYLSAKECLDLGLIHKILE